MWEIKKTTETLVMSSEQDKKSESKSIDLARELKACELTDKWLENYNWINEGK